MKTKIKVPVEAVRKNRRGWWLGLGLALLPGWVGCTTPTRARALVGALLALCWMVTGCQTFNYTDADRARDLKRADSWANGGWRGGMGCGNVSISPKNGNISCPAGLGGGMCPGK